MWLATVTSLEHLCVGGAHEDEGMGADGALGMRRQCDPTVVTVTVVVIVFRSNVGVSTDAPCCLGRGCSSLALEES